METAAKLLTGVKQSVSEYESSLCLRRLGALPFTPALPELYPLYLSSPFYKFLGTNLFSQLQLTHENSKSLKFAKRVEFKCSHKRERCEVIDVLTQHGDLLQYVCIVHHHIVHLKYFTILFVTYTSIKLGEKGGREGRGREERSKSISQNFFF